MINKLNIIFMLLMAIFFTTCKKYPENNLWFKNPEKISLLQGFITAYTVNGIDSLDLLNSYYVPITANTIYPYYYMTTHDIKKEEFTGPTENHGFYIVYTNLCEPIRFGYEHIDKKMKYIAIRMTVDTLYYKKNLFPGYSSNNNWEILYLDKKGEKLKIKNTYHGNTYEVTFEK